MGGKRAPSTDEMAGGRQVDTNQGLNVVWYRTRIEGRF
jgi:hypothetical protein